MQRISKDEYYLNIARAVSQRSTCLSKRYGCVIVKNDEIIATGYNGSPRGEVNCCDIGKCARKKEGGHYANDGNYDSCCSVHAEQNAIISASRKDMIGSTLYLWGGKEKYIDGINYLDYPLDKVEPCPICKRMIKNAGIKEIVTAGAKECLL